MECQVHTGVSTTMRKCLKTQECQENAKIFCDTLRGVINRHTNTIRVWFNTSFLTVYLWPVFGKPDLLLKMLFRVVHRFSLVTGILSILNFGVNHKEQSLSFLLVHI